ncbi:MAG: SulP family inorganic anion transporter [Xanthomonadaceae bacterium]|nr:SulP family inorganic anion transporter [Xanthomonadaceae bacterium]
MPAADWLPALRDPRVLRTETVAGVSVAMILIPQAVAYAQLAGLPPQSGLYAACLPVMVAALFGVARPLQAGPTALISLMTAAALAPIVAAGGTAWIVYALALAFLVGVFQFAFGLLRLGQLVNFLANPVVAGFTSAAAIIIGTSQLGVLFRIEQPHEGWHFLGVVRVLAEIPTAAHLPTVLLALLTAGVILLVKRLAPRLPAYLIALALATLVAWSSGFARAGGSVIGTLPTGFPMLTLPSLAPWIIADLFIAAVIIALIAFVESATVTRTLAARSRQSLDLDREMISQGLANMTAGIAQGYPVSSSLARSHYAWTAGARTGFAALVAGAVAGVTILFAAPLFYHLPRAALAVVIIFAIGGLLSFKPLLRALRAHRQDGITGIVTFVVALLVAPALHQAVLIGVALSLGLFLYRSMRPHALALGRHPDGSLRNATLYKLPPCDQITVLRFDGPLYFANAGHFSDSVLAALSAKPSLRYIIVDCSGIAEMDATGEQVLAAVQRELHEAGVVLMLTAVRSTVRDVLVRTRLLKTIGLDHTFRDTDAALEWAWQRLEPGHRDRCPLRLFPTG